MQGGGRRSAAQLPSEARTQDHTGRGQKKRRSKGTAREKGDASTESKGRGQEAGRSAGAGDPMPPAASPALWFRTLAPILGARTAPFPIEDDDRIKDYHDNE